MKYFTITELCKSSTAAQKKIDNTPNSEVVNNLKKLVEYVLDPLREKYGKPIHVNGAYRCPALNKAVGYKGVQLVTISRPTAYGEYAPYYFAKDEKEFENLVKSMR